MNDSVYHPRIPLVDPLSRGLTLSTVRSRMKDCAEYRFRIASQSRSTITNEYFLYHPVPLSSLQHLLSATSSTESNVSPINYQNHIAFSFVPGGHGDWVILNEAFDYIRLTQCYDMGYSTFVMSIIYVEYLQLHAPDCVGARNVKLLMDLYFREWNQKPPLVV